jgi:hypothetical protein
LRPYILDGHLGRCTVKAGGPDDANRSFTSSRIWSVAISPQEQFYVYGRVREASRIVASQPLRVHLWQLPSAPATTPAPATTSATAPEPAPASAGQLVAYASEDVREAPNNRDQVVLLAETLTNLCYEFPLIQGILA